jgi:gamma-glutamyltranspeptidase/glutathione hydrolase
MFRNPDLARSLELIAKDGRDGFYKGTIAQRIVATELKLGGVMSAEDLAEFAS